MKILSVVLGLSLIASLSACTKSELQEASKSAVSVVENTATTVQETGTEMMEEGGEMMEEVGEEVMEKTGEIMEEVEETVEALAATYTRYDESAGEGKKHILFFYADWCPTCVKWEQQLNEAMDMLPGNALILKAEYDNEEALRSQYEVAKQSTAVFINADGSVAKKESDPSIESMSEFFSS